MRELTVAANFVEVYLAKEGHDGRVGVNYLRKIELLDRLAGHEPVTLPIRVQGATSADGDFAVAFDPGELFGGSPPPHWPPLRRPRFTAIVASVDLAGVLAADPLTRPDGFVVEGHPAGGHNAPPRGPRHLDPTGQPVYDQRDIVGPDALAGLGPPYWMAGGYATSQGLARAVAAGAQGIQAGTIFARCRESGMAAPHPPASRSRWPSCPAHV